MVSMVVGSHVGIGHMAVEIGERADTDNHTPVVVGGSDNHGVVVVGDIDNQGLDVDRMVMDIQVDTPYVAVAAAVEQVVVALMVEVAPLVVEAVVLDENIVDDYLLVLVGSTDYSQFDFAAQ